MNLLRTILMLLGVLFISNCASTSYQYTLKPVAPYTTRVIPIWIDKTFSGNDMLAIDDAINNWNLVLNGSIKLQPVSYQFDMEPDEIMRAIRERGLLVMKVTSDNSMVDKDTRAWVNELGGFKLYVVKDRVPTEIMTGIMMHELGHALGASHQTGNTLMFPYYRKEMYYCIDFATVKQVSDYQKIRLDYLNHCVYSTKN
jgi:hypothetical protein